MHPLFQSSSQFNRITVFIIPLHFPALFAAFRSPIISHSSPLSSKHLLKFLSCTYLATVNEHLNILFFVNVLICSNRFSIYTHLTRVAPSFPYSLLIIYAVIQPISSRGCYSLQTTQCQPRFSSVCLMDSVPFSLILNVFKFLAHFCVTILSNTLVTVFQLRCSMFRRSIHFYHSRHDLSTTHSIHPAVHPSAPSCTAQFELQMLTSELQCINPLTSLLLRCCDQCLSSTLRATQQSAQ